MLLEAIQKLRTEMEQSPNNPYVHVVGDYLLKHLNETPQDAEKILNPDKSITKSLDEMRNVAAKKKVGNCAVLTDQEGFDIVLKYFGINGKPVPKTDNESVLAAPIKQSPSFEIKLEDLL